MGYEISPTLPLVTHDLTIIQGKKGDGELKFKYPGNPIKLRFYVLDTDYENYASLYLCYRLFNKNLFKLEMGWVLTRESEPSDDVVYNDHVLHIYTSYCVLYDN